MTKKCSLNKVTVTRNQMFNEQSLDNSSVNVQPAKVNITQKQKFNNQS